MIRAAKPKSPDKSPPDKSSPDKSSADKSSALSRSDRSGDRPPPANARGRIVDAMLELAAERPFAELTIGDIAARAGVSLADFRDLFPSKGAVLGAFSRRIDRVVLDGASDELLDESDKERLFDVLMRRIDALAPYRDAMRSVADWARRDPLAAAAFNSLAINSMRFMMEAAGVRNEGPLAPFKLQGLVVLWMRVFSVWLKDEEEGYPATMAELDRGLARGQTAIARAEDLGRLAAPLCSFVDALRETGQRMRARAASRLKDDEETGRDLAR